MAGRTRACRAGHEPYPPEPSAALLCPAAAGRVSGELGAVVQGTVGIGPAAPAIDALVADGSTDGRAQALCLYTAVRLIQRTAPGT